MSPLIVERLVTNLVKHPGALIDSPSPDALEVERAIHAELHRRGLSAQVRTDATFAMLRVKLFDLVS